MWSTNLDLKILDENQKKVVKSLNGKYLVKGFTGTGKTKTLINRIDYLVQSGVKPIEIITLFTNKKTMNVVKNRLGVNKISKSNNIVFNTFSSLFLEILSRNKHELGIVKYTVINDDDIQKIINEFYSKYFFNKKDLSKIISIINKWGKEGWSPDEVKKKANYGDIEVNKEFIDIYEDYTNSKQKNEYIDFNDIPILINKLFDENPKILNKYSSQFKYIMVDDFQNLLPMELKLFIRLFSHNNYMVFANDISNLYLYQDSIRDNVNELLESSSDVISLVLENNYRNSEVIENAAKDFIYPDSSNNYKNTISSKYISDPIYLFESSCDLGEAEDIVWTINSFTNSEKYTYDDIMIISRTFNKIKIMERKLLSAGIPYEVVGRSKSFHERDGIKDMLNVLKSFTDSYRGFAPPNEEFIEKGREMIRKNDVKIGDLFQYINDCSDTLAKFDRGSEARKNLWDLAEISTSFDEKHLYSLNNDKTIVDEFLTFTSYKITDESKPRVLLMRPQSSYGLESEIVFIYNMIDDVFPNFYSHTKNEIFIEKNLFYLAMTRAKQKLIITYNTLEDYSIYDITGIDNKISRFINLIPIEYKKDILKRFYLSL